VDGLGFIADLNYDDQNMTAPPVLSPGQPFVKSWRVQNTGACSWQPEYALVYVNGNRAGANMGAQAQPIGRTVDPGEYLDISVSLTAPQQYGTYQGFWQMRNTDGNYFGQTMWVGITVPDPNPPPPPPPPPPSNPNPNLRADNTYLNAGQCTTVRWDVDNVNAVYFVTSQGPAGVAGHGSQTVCPPVTTTYILRVVQTNGATVEYPITINVGGGAPPYTANFWADQNEIYLGDCTKLRWDVQGVQAVYLDGNGVVGVGSQKECPKSSKTYKLSIVLVDGSTQTLEQRIKVRGLMK